MQFPIQSKDFLACENSLHTRLYELHVFTKYNRAKSLSFINESLKQMKGWNWDNALSLHLVFFKLLESAMAIN